jgi:hypothetical protein
MLRSALALALTATLTACSHPSRYTDDVRALCDAPNDPAVKKLAGGNLDLSQQSRVMKASVTDKLKTPEGRALLGVLDSEAVAPADKGKKLAAEAARVGVSPCAFADWWEAIPPPHPGH